LTDQTANARNRAAVRILIGVLIAVFAIYGVTHIQPSDDAATLAGRAFVGILIAVLSIYLMASGIKSVTSSACGFSNSDTVD
jgi:succinate-acetate transporter protein